MALDKFQPYLFVSAGEQSNKYLTPTITNGIAQFQAQRKQSLTGLTVRIDPIQSGSGDPSPTNIRPISGRTGLTVTRSGKNLLQNALTSSTNRGITATVNADGTVTLTGTNDGSSYSLFVINNFYAVDGVEYILSGAVSANILLRNVGAAVTDTGNGVSFTGNGTSQRIEIRVVAGTAISGSVVVKPMIRRASISDCTFVPYTEQTYPITWETEAGTVYGGNVDVISGKLTVTHAYKEYTGQTSEAWTASSWTKTNTFVAYSNVDIADSKKEGSRYMCITACNMLPLMGYDELRNADTNGITITGGMTASYPSIRIDKTVASTVAELQTYLASNPLTIVYELATPQTYNITPEDIKTLAGFNQIYSDAGPVIDIKF